MRRSRFMIALTCSWAPCSPSRPRLFARADGGQGWYGETTDKDITNVMFITIAFFPVVILIFSLIQSRLDKRKHARMDAAKAPFGQRRLARRLVGALGRRAGHGAARARRRCLLRLAPRSRLPAWRRRRGLPCRR